MEQKPKKLIERLQDLSKHGVTEKAMEDGWYDPSARDPENPYKNQVVLQNTGKAEVIFDMKKIENRIRGNGINN